jgi:HEAT repeat protein
MLAARCFVLVVGLLLTLVAPVPAAEDEAADPDEWILKEAKVGTGGPALLTFLRQRSAHDEDLRQLDRLVRQLGSEEFQERQEASERLTKLGLAALPALRQARTNENKEIARRAEACMEEIAREPTLMLSLSAVRRLVQLRPKGTIEALVRFLPYAADEALEEEVCFGVDTLAVAAGKLDAAILAALKDELPARRALAACLAGRLGNREQKEEARKLLADKDPLVRLRAAQGLLTAREKDAIPVLVALLNEPDAAIAWQAEDLLHYVAGEEAPDEVVGSCTTASRKKCQAAWEAWWKRSSEKCDLTRLDRGTFRPGLLWVYGVDRVHKNAAVWLYGCDGKPRWQLGGNWCLVNGVAFFPNNRVQVLHILEDKRGQPDRLSEFSLEGKELWHQDFHVETLRDSCWLPNGNIVVHERPHIPLELTPDGKVIEFKERATPLDDPLRARLMKYHSTPVDRSALTLEDPITGRIIKTIRAEEKLEDLYPDETLPGGNILFLGQKQRNSVYVAMEIDREGKTVWRCEIPDCLFVERLRNGNLLVKSNQYVHRLFELTQDGRTVWEMFIPEGELRFVHARRFFGLVRLGFVEPRPKDMDLDTPSARAQQLKHKDAKVRQTAARFLEGTGPEYEREIPRLVEAIDDEDRLVRELALNALVTIGPASLPGLKEALRHKNPKVRSYTAIALAQLKGETDQVVAALRVTLKDEDARVRMSVLYGLAIVGPAAKAAVPDLVECFKDRAVVENQSIRSKALHTLEQIGREAKSATPEVLKALEGEDSELHYSAARALGALAPGDEVVIAALVRTLKEKGKGIARIGAADGLGRMGPAAKGAVGDLLEVAKERSPNAPKEEIRVRAGVVLALGAIGKEGDRVVPVLVALLEDQQEAVEVRRRAIQSLGKFGDAAKVAIPALQEAAKEKDLNSDANTALQKLKGK